VGSVAVRIWRVPCIGAGTRGRVLPHVASRTLLFRRVRSHTIVRPRWFTHLRGSCCCLLGRDQQNDGPQRPHRQRSVGDPVHARELRVFACRPSVLSCSAGVCLRPSDLSSASLSPRAFTRSRLSQPKQQPAGSGRRTRIDRAHIRIADRPVRRASRDHTYIESTRPELTHAQTGLPTSRTSDELTVGSSSPTNPGRLCLHWTNQVSEDQLTDVNS
jgi:hypothetical protein